MKNKFAFFLKKNSNLILFISVFLFTIILLSISSGYTQRRLLNTSSIVISGSQRGLGSVAGMFEAIGDYFKSRKRLKIENEQFRIQIEQLNQQQILLQELQNENKNLNEQFELSRSLNYSFITAKVVAKDPKVDITTFIINKGSKAGIEKNMPVVAFQDSNPGLIGRVIEVNPLTAKILPIYDINCQVAVRFIRTRAEGIAVGDSRHDYSLKLLYISEKMRDYINYKDMIVTSGLSSIYPAGIPVATVKNVQKGNEGATLKIDLDPVVDFSRIEYLYIITNNQSEIDLSIRSIYEN